MFIVSLNYIKELEEVDKYLDAHIAYLKGEYVSGNFIASGRKIPRTGGVILSRVKTKRELEEIIERDPFFQSGIAEYDITEFTPSMVADEYLILKE